MSLDITLSQLTANCFSRSLSEAASSRPRSTGATATFDACHCTVAVQQPVAVSEPLVERFLGAARPPGDGVHRQGVALLDEEPQRGLQHSRAAAA